MLCFWCMPDIYPDKSVCQYYNLIIYKTLGFISNDCSIFSCKTPKKEYRTYVLVSNRKTSANLKLSIEAIILLLISYVHARYLRQVPAASGKVKRLLLQELQYPIVFSSYGYVLTRIKKLNTSLYEMTRKGGFCEEIR